VSTANLISTPPFPERTFSVNARAFTRAFTHISQPFPVASARTMHHVEPADALVTNQDHQVNPSASVMAHDLGGQLQEIDNALAARVQPDLAHHYVSLHW
jgi:hypothetical protein